MWCSQLLWPDHTSIFLAKRMLYGEDRLAEGRSLPRTHVLLSTTAYQQVSHIASEIGFRCRIVKKQIGTADLGLHDAIIKI
jgi:hypothetical protein